MKSVAKNMDYIVPRIDAIILNLNEINVVRDSIRRMKKDGLRIIVVDNGSDDGGKEELQETDGIELVDLKENTGQSRGRNIGLSYSRSEYVLLLDGDILYIPGSAQGMLEEMKKLRGTGCLGLHNPRCWGGTQIRSDADIRWPKNPGKPYNDFDMAWTQYGLFDGKMLRDLGFVTSGAFGEPGVGYEDDWLWHEMARIGKKSYYLPDLVYYHEQHGGKRYLEAHGLPVRDDERKAEFLARWRERPWYDKPLHTEWAKDNQGA